MATKPVYYCQWDSKWGKLSYSITRDPSQTIGNSGCGPTCVAMILATWFNRKMTPKDTCALAVLLKDRTANEGTSWEFFKHVADRYKMKYKQSASTNEALEALKAGALVICSMTKGYFTQHGHFILAWKADNNAIYVNDPNNAAKTSATISLFRGQCAQYFIFSK